jgi:biopolymer transport protein ExbD
MAKRARIEIIPLIDVIFFLLATFILITFAMNRSGGLSGVTPPEANSGVPREDKGAVTISVTTQGLIGWDKISVTPEEFIARLKAWKQITPDPRILINGDKDATFQQVRYIVDEVRKAGINKIHIETKLTQNK